MIFNFFRKFKKDKTKVFIDMDGTLAKWQPEKTYDEIKEKGYFATLPPMDNMVKAINFMLSEKNNVEYYILSAVLNESCEKDKLRWLKENVPNMPKKNCIFVPNGENKALFVSKKFNMPINKNWILIDDFSTNLHRWKAAGGTGIKILNGINATKGTWTGYSIPSCLSSLNIANNIQLIIS